MSYYRHPKTTQERKLWTGLCIDSKEFDVNIKLRAARSARNLPNAWDDWVRSSYQVKSWKNYRTQQYR